MFIPQSAIFKNPTKYCIDAFRASNKKRQLFISEKNLHPLKKAFKSLLQELLYISQEMMSIISSER